MIARRLTAALAATVLLTAAAPVALLPHVAQYEITLARGNPAGGIADMNGRMVTEIADACGGYTTTQRLMADIADPEGNSTRTDFVFTGWESTEGREFRFDTTNSVNGEAVDHYRGRASTPSSSAGGRAVFDDPADTATDLPAGTLFPNAHMEALIVAARAGKTSFSRIVFQGSSTDDVMEAAAFIGKEKPPGPGGFAGAVAVAGLKSWPIVLSFYKVGSPDATPEYEIGMRLYENGVAADLRMSYPEFALKGKLVRVAMLPSKC